MRPVADPGGSGAVNRALRWTMLVSAVAEGSPIRPPHLLLVRYGQPVPPVPPT